MDLQRALQVVALLGFAGAGNAAIAADLLGDWGTSEVACSGGESAEDSEGFGAISIVRPEPGDDLNSHGVCTAMNPQDDDGVTRFDLTCSFEGEQTVWASVYNGETDAITALQDGREPATYRRCR